MVEIGIKELKDDLSGVLNRVAAGEAIRITKHGKPFVDLAAAVSLADLTTEQQLDRLVSLGILTPPKNRRRGPRVPTRTFEFSSSPVAAIIEERDRERNQR